MHLSPIQFIYPPIILLLIYPSTQHSFPHHSTHSPTYPSIYPLMHSPTCPPINPLIYLLPMHPSVHVAFIILVINWIVQIPNGFFQLLLDIRIRLLFSCSILCNSATAWTGARQASLFFTVSWSLLKLMSIESVMPACRH